MRAAILFARLAAGLEIPEELGIRLEHEHVALVLEALLVGFEAAVERIKFGVRLIGAGVDRGRFRVALTFDALRIAIRLRQYDFALAIGIGADLLDSAEPVDRSSFATRLRSASMRR